MRRERIQPVTRTYNTLMIACNTSNQWQARLRSRYWLDRFALDSREARLGGSAGRRGTILPAALPDCLHAQLPADPLAALHCPLYCPLYCRRLCGCMQRWRPGGTSPTPRPTMPSSQVRFGDLLCSPQLSLLSSHIQHSCDVQRH